jgi:hypothetical protein
LRPRRRGACKTRWHRRQEIAGSLLPQYFPGIGGLWGLSETERRYLLPTPIVIDATKSQGFGRHKTGHALGRQILPFDKEGHSGAFWAAKC